MAREKRRFSVYVIELNREVCRLHDCTCKNGKPPVYVGETYLTPEERLAQHKSGYKSSKYVRDYGLRLRPRLSRAYGPYETRAEAKDGEQRRAASLRRKGFCVFGGH